MDTDIVHGSTIKAMQRSNGVKLGPHASIAVREWKLLRNMVAVMTPMSIDADYLRVANVTAVSR